MEECHEEEEEEEMSLEDMSKDMQENAQSAKGAPGEQAGPAAATSETSS